MTRKMLDCREVPSDSDCSLTLTGEEDEVLRAGAAHAVDVHGHTDNEELRAGLRAALRDPAQSSSEPGAFLQLIEMKTRRVDDIVALDRQWEQAIGDARTTRWSIVTQDRDRADTYVVLVEFPNFEAAKANSDSPATADFATRMAKLCDQEPVFRNLDVREIGV